MIFWYWQHTGKFYGVRDWSYDLRPTACSRTGKCPLIGIPPLDAVNSVYAVMILAINADAAAADNIDKMTALIHTAEHACRLDKGTSTGVYFPRYVVNSWLPLRPIDPERFCVCDDRELSWEVLRLFIIFNVHHGYLSCLRLISAKNI